MRSEAINELAEALSKAQSEIQDAEKNANNPHYGKSYADLSAVLQATREPLSKNFLSVSQIVVSEGDDYFLETTLLHKSGQFISAKLKLLLMKKDMQGLGGAITYARRYSLASIVGIAQEDADGEPPKTQYKQYEPKNAPQTPPVPPPPKVIVNHAESAIVRSKEEQADYELRRKLFSEVDKLCKKHKYNTIEYITSMYPDKTAGTLTANQLDYLIDELNSIGGGNGN